MNICLGTAGVLIFLLSISRYSSKATTACARQTDLSAIQESVPHPDVPMLPTTSNTSMTIAHQESSKPSSSSQSQSEGEESFAYEQASYDMESKVLEEDVNKSAREKNYVPSLSDFGIQSGRENILKNYYADHHLSTSTISYDALYGDHYSTHKSPSDTSGSVGKDHILLLISGRINIYNKSDPDQILFTNKLGSFFRYNVSYNGTNHIPQSDVFDSRSYFDSQSNRFFIVTSSKAKPNVHYSRCILAVSDIHNPLKWIGYTMVGHYNNHWIQFPMLGMNSKYIVISTKAMDAKTLPIYSFMNYNHIYVIDRKALLDEGQLKYAISKGPLSGPKSWDWQPCRGSFDAGPLCVMSASFTGYVVGEVYLVDTTIMQKNTVTTYKEKETIEKEKIAVEEKRQEGKEGDKLQEGKEEGEKLPEGKERGKEEIAEKELISKVFKTDRNNLLSMSGEGENLTSTFDLKVNITNTVNTTETNSTAPNPMLEIPDDLIYPTLPSSNLIAIYKPLNDIHLPDSLNLEITPAEVYQLRCSGVVSTGGIRINSDIYQSSDGVIYAAKGFCTEKGYLDPDEAGHIHVHRMRYGMRSAYSDARPWVNKRRKKPVNVQDDDDYEYEDNDDSFDDYKDDDLDDSYDEVETLGGKGEDDDDDENDRNNNIDYNTPFCVGTVGILWVAIERDNGRLLSYDTIQDPYMHYFYPSITAMKDQYAIIGFNGASDYGFIGSYYSLGLRKDINQTSTETEGDYEPSFATSRGHKAVSVEVNTAEGTFNRSEASLHSPIKVDPHLTPSQNTEEQRGMKKSNRIGVSGWSWDFQEPIAFQKGLHSFCRKKSYKVLVPWGDYSTTILDPLNPWISWTFQSYVPHRNRWKIRMAKIMVNPNGNSIDAESANDDNQINNKITMRWISLYSIFGILGILCIFYIIRNGKEQLDFVTTSFSDKNLSNVKSRSSLSSKKDEEIIKVPPPPKFQQFHSNIVDVSLEWDKVSPIDPHSSNDSIEYMKLSRNSTVDSASSESALIGAGMEVLKCVSRNGELPEGISNENPILMTTPVIDSVENRNNDSNNNNNNRMHYLCRLTQMESQESIKGNDIPNVSTSGLHPELYIFNSNSCDKSVRVNERDEDTNKDNSSSLIFGGEDSDHGAGGLVDLEKIKEAYKNDYYGYSNPDSPTKIPLRSDIGESFLNPDHP